MAYIRKLPSGRYQVQIRRANLKTISKTFALMKDAKLWAAQIEADHKKAEKLGTLSTITLSKVLDDFIEHYDKLLINGDKKDTNVATRLAFWKEQYGDILILQFEPIHVRTGIKTLLSVGSTPGKIRPLKPQTSNRFKANLSTALSWAIDEEAYGLELNPCRQISSKAEGKGRKRTFTDEEKTAFLEVAKVSDWDKFYLFVLMGFTTGARRGELQKLRWNNIDFKNRVACLHDTKNGDDRNLPLIAPVLAELQKFREISTGLVFLGDYGAVHDYRGNWVDALKQAGIPEYDERYGERLTFHSTRHTFCTNLHSQGQDMKVIQSLAGHKSIQTTLRYTHDDEARKAKAVQDVFGAIK